MKFIAGDKVIAKSSFHTLVEGNVYTIEVYNDDNDFVTLVEDLCSYSASRFALYDTTTSSAIAVETDEDSNAIIMALANRDETPKDVVNHPPHYTDHPSGIECIQITEHMNFNLGNAIKYIWRADLKNGLEDLKKAEWYIKREIEKRTKKG